MTSQSTHNIAKLLEDFYLGPTIRSHCLLQQSLTSRLDRQLICERKKCLVHQVKVVYSQGNRRLEEEKSNYTLVPEIITHSNLAAGALCTCDQLQIQGELCPRLRSLCAMCPWNYPHQVELHRVSSRQVVEGKFSHSPLTLIPSKKGENLSNVSE